MKFKKGDTLVEVALAIGIFSMVAITVVSVVNSSTSSAQSALEVTITREEIDAQAEALRFIHDSYSTGDDTGSTSSLSSNTTYSNIWNKIISLAKTVPTDGESTDLEYQPSTCEELYANGDECTPAAMVPTPLSATSFTLTAAVGLIFFRSKMS